MDEWEKENEARKAEATNAVVGIKNKKVEHEEKTASEKLPTKTEKMPANRVSAAAVKIYQKRRRMRALVLYRQMLGVQGQERTDENGNIVRRGLPQEVQERLAKEGGVRREAVMRRVKHFSRGVILGSRKYIDEWFERNRQVCQVCRGQSRESRKTGARSIGIKALRGLYSFRQLSQD